MLDTTFGVFFMNKKKRNKFSVKDRERAVLKILEGGRFCLSVARDLQTSHSLVRRWGSAYKLHGKEGLSFKNKLRYTGDFNFK